MQGNERDGYFYKNRASIYYLKFGDDGSLNNVTGKSFSNGTFWSTDLKEVDLWVGTQKVNKVALTYNMKCDAFTDWFLCGLIG